MFLESQEVREITERHGGGQESHTLHTRLVTVLGKAQLQRQRCPWHRSSLPSGRGSGPSPRVPRSAARAERHAIATSRSAAPREASAQLRAGLHSARSHPRAELRGTNGSNGRSSKENTGEADGLHHTCPAPGDQSARPHLRPHTPQRSLCWSSTGDPRVSFGAEGNVPNPRHPPCRCLPGLLHGT